MYQPKWEAEFKWLIYDNQAKVYCKYCRSIYGPYGELARKQIQAGLSQDHNNNTKLASGPFVSGCSNLKKDVLIQHSKSRGHLDAQRKWDIKQLKPGSSEAEKALGQMNKSIMEKLSILMRNAHAIGKKSRPFSDFSWITQLDEKKGVNVGQTYRNDKSCREFLRAIAAVERKKITQQLQSANFVTIMSDGSTDVATIENEIVYIRFAIRGVIETYFIAMVPVEKADAKGVLQSLKKALGHVSTADSSDKPPVQKIVAYCCYGASVNTGQTGGVIALLRKEIWSGIVLVKCLVHRLELSFKDGMKGVKVYEKFICLLSGLYNFYHVSPLQRSNLKNAFKTVGRNPVMPQRVGGTRWIGHTTNAIEKLWQAFEPIVIHLGQVRNFILAVCIQHTALIYSAKIDTKHYRKVDLMHFHDCL